MWFETIKKLIDRFEIVVFKKPKIMSLFSGGTYCKVNKIYSESGNLLDFTHPNRARHVSTNIYIYCLFWFQFCSLCNASEQRQKDDISPVYIHQIGDSFEANQTLNRSLFFIFYCPALFFFSLCPIFYQKRIFT